MQEVGVKPTPRLQAPEREPLDIEDVMKNLLFLACKIIIKFTRIPRDVDVEFDRLPSAVRATVRGHRPRLLQPVKDLQVPRLVFRGDEGQWRRERLPLAIGRLDLEQGYIWSWLLLDMKDLCDAETATPRGATWVELAEIDGRFNAALAVEPGPQLPASLARLSRSWTRENQRDMAVGHHDTRGDDEPGSNLTIPAPLVERDGPRRSEGRFELRLAQLGVCGPRGSDRFVNVIVTDEQAGPENRIQDDSGLGASITLRRKDEADGLFIGHRLVQSLLSERATGFDHSPRQPFFHGFAESVRASPGIHPQRGLGHIQSRLHLPNQEPTDGIEVFWSSDGRWMGRDPVVGRLRQR